jgi:hypothetical protein
LKGKVDTFVVELSKEKGNGEKVTKELERIKKELEDYTKKALEELKGLKSDKAILSQDKEKLQGTYNLHIMG